MILTQKYHSATEIDPEFLPGLDRLLKDYVPSFEWIKNFELSSPESTHFTYYLFFGDRNNEPVGFAQLAIANSAEERPWYRKFFSNSPKTKHVRWTTPTSTTEGFIIDPFYAKKAMGKTKSIIQSYFERTEISWQSLTFSKVYNGLENIDGLTSHKSSQHQIANTLVKSGSNYQNYLEQRTEKCSKEIQENWKVLSSKMQIEIGDFKTFKSIFEYRSSGKNLYKNLKKDLTITPYLAEKTTFITFEKHQEIQAILFLIEGQSQHYFFDWKVYSSEITIPMLIQLAVMKFYEINDATHLHPLCQKDHFHYLEQAGFSSKSLYQVELNRTRQKNSSKASAKVSA